MQPNIKAIAIVFRGTSRIVDRLSVSRGMARSSLKAKSRRSIGGVSPSLPFAGESQSSDIEQYAITDTGVALRWSVYVPPDGGRAPRGHSAPRWGFKSGFPGPALSQGPGPRRICGVYRGYRFAPPHDEMNAPEHPPPSQNTVVPARRRALSQANERIQTAIRAARQDPRCNGLVYCVGGSTGGSHTVYLAARGTPGDDMPDLIVC